MTADDRRIDEFLKKFGDIWKKVPYLRFSQMFNNLQRACNSDLFYITDDKLLLSMSEFIDEFLEEYE